MPDELDRSYPLTEMQIAQYRRNGYIKLAEVLSARTLAEYAPEITRVLRAWTLKRFLAEYGIQVPNSGTAREHTDPPATSGTYARAFTQRLNLWRMSSKVERFVRSRRLARIASELMGVR